MKRLRGLGKHLEGQWPKVFLSLLFSAISVIAKMAVPYMAGLLINDFTQSEFGRYDTLLILIGTAIVVSAIFRYAFEVLIASIGQNTVKSLRNSIMSSIVKAKVSALDGKRKADLMVRVTSDVEHVQNGLVLGAAALFDGVSQIAVTLVFMFMLNWVLALTVICLCPISVLVSRFVSSSNAKYFKERNAQTSILGALSLERIENSECIKAYCLEADEAKRFKKTNDSAAFNEYRASFAAGWINPSTRLVNNTIYATLVFLGALIIIENPPIGVAFMVGDLSAFLAYAYQFMSPFNEVSNVMAEINYAISSYERIEGLCSIESEDVESGRKVGSVDVVEADSIRFSYDGKKEVLKGVSFSAKKGMKIALVGETGCGKSTFISLLMGFFEPNEGQLLINGEPLGSYSKQSLREDVGLVLQDPWLFKGTIKDNIGFAIKDASLEDIIEAAKKTGADEFIRLLPDGYNTMVSNNSGISYGQKQLLCVTRLMLTKTSMLVLDEATSSIDLLTEKELVSSFHELMQGKTSFIVAHRLSTIRDCDLICVMDKGIIVETGDFESLMNANGFFRRLYDSQLD